MNVCRFLTQRSIVQPLQQTLKRTLRTTTILNMPAKDGDKIPNLDLYEDNPGNKVNIHDLSKGKTLVVFAVPGAFTPGCSKTHLPGYIEMADKIKSTGASEIICISVNDPFVMNAWGKEHGTQGKIRMLADPSGAFTKALDLGQDIAPLGGFRSKRYSMVVKDGVISDLQVEPDGTGLSCSPRCFEA